MKLNKKWIVGFTDGDGHFGCWISKDNKPAIRFNYSINQHQRDIKVLYAFKEYFQCGRISKPYYTDQGKNGPYYRYEISNRKLLQEKIIPFFKENTLYTRKQHSFEIWCNLIQQVDQGLHLLPDHVENLRIQKSVMNNGQMPGCRKNLIDPQWIAGFVDAEGMFAIGNETSNYALTFGLTQSEIDQDLLQELQKYFNLGNIKKSRNTYVYTVTSLKHIINKIIPFFEKNKLCTSKNFNFLKFRQVALLKDKKLHLTVHGRKRINNIVEKFKDHNRVRSI